MTELAGLRRVIVHPVLAPSVCDELVASAESTGWEDGVVGTDGVAPRYLSRGIRSCKVRPVPDAPVLDTLGAFLRRANEAVFGLELTGFFEPDPPMVLRYEQGDHFEWHMDLGPTGPAASRKLVISVQLSPAEAYEGGDLQVAPQVLTSGSDDRADWAEAARGQGVATAFCALHLHRVTPVTRGVRYALVAWAHGPPFR